MDVALALGHQGKHFQLPGAQGFEGDSPLMAAAEEFLPAGAVKRHSMGVPSKHLTGMAKAMRRAAKAAVILKEGPGAVGKEKNKKSE